jgi:hypothetical protein
MLRRRSARAGLVFVAAFAWGCSDGNSPKVGKGDTVFHDVDATIIPPPPAPEAGGADSPYGPLADGDYGAYAFSPTAVCMKCACGAGTYCFGGGTGYTTFSGTCTGASSLAVGCQPLPAACASAPTCPCLFQALNAQVGCYPVCEQLAGGLMVYCPSP